jgi:hypothetical protein
MGWSSDYRLIPYGQITYDDVGAGDESSVLQRPAASEVLDIAPSRWDFAAGATCTSPLLNKICAESLAPKRLAPLRQTA